MLSAVIIDPLLAVASTATSNPTTVSIYVVLIVGATGVIGAAIPQIASTLRETRQAQRNLDKIRSPEGALETRLDELSESMRRSARLVEQVSAELEARAATARRLQE